MTKIKITDKLPDKTLINRALPQLKEEHALKLRMSDREEKEETKLLQKTRTSNQVRYKTCTFHDKKYRKLTFRLKKKKIVKEIAREHLAPTQD